MDPLAISAIICAVFAGVASLLALIKNSKCFCMEVSTRDQPLQISDPHSIAMAQPIINMTPNSTPQISRKAESNV